MSFIINLNEPKVNTGYVLLGELQGIYNQAKESPEYYFPIVALSDVDVSLNKVRNILVEFKDYLNEYEDLVTGVGYRKGRLILDGLDQKVIAKVLFRFCEVFKSVTDIQHLSSYMDYVVWEILRDGSKGLSEFRLEPESLTDLEDNYNHGMNMFNGFTLMEWLIEFQERAEDKTELYFTRYTASNWGEHNQGYYLVSQFDAFQEAVNKLEKIYTSKDPMGKSWARQPFLNGPLFQIIGPLTTIRNTLLPQTTAYLALSNHISEIYTHLQANCEDVVI